MSKNLKERLEYVLDNENGFSNVEYVVWVSVVLIVITLFFIFKDAIVDFIRRVFNSMDRKHSGSSYISGE